MILLTTIPPRRDGTVILRDKDGTPNIFKAEKPGGDLVCDVTNEATISDALRSGNFDPVLEADFDQAKALLNPDQGDGAEDDPADEGDDDEAADAPPVESQTTPAPGGRRGRKARAQ